MKWGYVQKDASVRSVYRINICDANEAFMFVRSTNPVQLCASDVAISSDITRHIIRQSPSYLRSPRSKYVLPAKAGTVLVFAQSSIKVKLLNH